MLITRQTVAERIAAYLHHKSTLAQLVDGAENASTRANCNSRQSRRLTWTYYESKCATLDRQIDRLVYELYELTPEEIAIVEGAGK